jgi:hypothetical protein
VKPIETDFDGTIPDGTLVKVTTGAVVSTVNPALTVGPTLPLGSTPYNAMVWAPSANPLNTDGLVQVVAAAPSNEHQVVLLGSLLVNATVAVWLVIVAAGVEVSVRVGPVVSTVKLVVIDAPTLPTASTP